MREPGRHRVEQEPGRLDGVARDGDHAGGEEALGALTVAHVHHAGGPAARLVDLDPGSHATGPDLHVVSQGVGQVGDVRAGLGIHLAALKAVAAVDAVRPVAEHAVGDPHGPDPHLDAELSGAFPHAHGRAGDGVRAVRVAVRLGPGPVLAGHGKLPLHPLVVADQVAVADGPVGTDPVDGPGGEVARMEAGAVAGVVHHGSSDAAAGIVLAHFDGVRAAHNALLRPVQGVAARLVGHPVLVGVPERARLQDHDPPAPAGQALGQNRASRPGADHHQVHLFSFGVADHRVLARKITAVLVEQPAGVVVLRPDRSFEPAPVQTSPRRVAAAGSSLVAPGFSKGSRKLTGPMRMNPRG